MKATPTSLLTSQRLRRIDAALGDWVARAFPADPPETALAAALAARAVADGHSALALKDAQRWLARLDGDGQAPKLPAAGAWSAALQHASAVQSGAVADGIRPLVLDAQGRVYLRRYFEYEQALAHALVAHARGVGSVGGSASTLANVVTDALDPEQQRAIDIALTHRFTLVTGGPGNGKTFVVARILAALAVQAHARAEPLRIALAAPTGKAAARLRESVQVQIASLPLSAAVAALMPRDATTLHRLIGLSPWQAKPRHDTDSPLPFDVLVVDEVSMVDLPLMAKLLAAVPRESRLILLGDPDQLSAVEAGNVLGALVEAARESPLRACHAALTRSHRFGADSALGALARAIVGADAEAALAACARDGDVALADAGGMARVVEQAATAYRPLLDARDAADALHVARGFRVLTALRHGPAGCVALDHAIAARLQRWLGLRADARWWRGRLILVTANRPELGLFNGDTGVIWPDASGTLSAWFETADGAPRMLPVAALPPHEGAFALTVHKAQGSEFERVALVTGPESAVLTRELLYTGVTRARAGITLHTTPDILRKGLANPTLRMTGLADRLREAATAPPPIAESLPPSA
jgi:exodeoxyribonuclease V alpha subunit